jgi:conjugal transfer ATP-binding protein TraC
MGLNLNTWLNKAQDLFYRISHTVGEDAGIKPESFTERHFAHQSLEVDLPSLAKLLPYETVTESHFFVNRNSAGFGLLLTPLSGADESLMKTLAETFKNKLSEGTDCTVLLYKHPWLSATLSQNYEPILKKEGIIAELARESLKYHLNAIQKGYKNGRNIPASLSDYCCVLLKLFIFCARILNPN